MEIKKVVSERSDTLSDTVDWAGLVTGLPETERIKLTGVIAGMQLARDAKQVPPDVRNPPERVS